MVETAHQDFRGKESEDLQTYFNFFLHKISNCQDRKIEEPPSPQTYKQELQWPRELSSEIENSLLRRACAWLLSQPDHKMSMTTFGQIKSLQPLSQTIKALPISKDKISPFFHAYPSLFIVTSIIGVHGPKLSLFGEARAPSFEAKLLEIDASNEVLLLCGVKVLKNGGHPVDYEQFANLIQQDALRRHGPDCQLDPNFALFLKYSGRFISVEDAGSASDICLKENVKVMQPPVGLKAPSTMSYFERKEEALRSKVEEELAVIHMKKECNKKKVENSFYLLDDDNEEDEEEMVEEETEEKDEEEGVEEAKGKERDLQREYEKYENLPYEPGYGYFNKYPNKSKYPSQNGNTSGKWFTPGSSGAICTFWRRGNCRFGKSCRDRHLNDHFEISIEQK